MVNFWSSMVGVTLPPTVRQNELPSALPDPKKVSLSQFMRWSLADQIAFIEAKGTGTTPKTVTIGDPGKQGDPDYPKPTITLGYKATSPQALTYADPLLQPAQVSKNDFMRWSPDNQLAYIARFKDASGAVYLGASQSKVELAANGDVMALGVLLPTAGDAEPIPYHHLPGSAAGTPSNVVVTSAEWLFPTLDGKKVTLPVGERPAAFYTTPAMLKDTAFTDDALPHPPGLTRAEKADAAKVEFLTDFAEWHSAYQLEYIKTHQSAPATPAGSPSRLDIVVGSPALRLTAFVSPDDPTKHFIVQSLDKAAIARMTRNEQDAVTKMGTAFDDLATSLGLSTVSDARLGAAQNTTNGGTRSATAPTPAPTAPFTATRYIDALIYDIDYTTAPTRVGGPTLPKDARDAFKSQLDILKEQIANSSIIAPADIQEKVDEIRGRFNRLFAFYNVREPTPETWQHNNGGTNQVTVYADVISSDATLASANRGYSVFLAQEKRIAELAEGRMKLVRADGVLNGKKLDVPYLVYKFQSLYNLSLEAQVVAETEEVNQQNDLLKTYAAMQDLINRTLSAYTKADDTKKAVLGLGDRQTAEIKQDEWKVFSMFEDFLSGSHQDPTGAWVGGQKHPLEVLRGITRPTMNLFRNAAYDPNGDTDDDGPDTDQDNPSTNYDLELFTYMQWNSFGTRLSETVTIINQNSQIKMNDINSMDKERNRHFELANNALAKMADILANIARA